MMTPGFPIDEQVRRFAMMTERQQEVMRTLVDLGTKRRAADALHISESTIKNHLNLVYARLDLKRSGTKIAYLGYLLGVIDERARWTTPDGDDDEPAN